MALQRRRRFRSQHTHHRVGGCGNVSHCGRRRLRLDPRQQSPELHSGNGGFALAAESDQPLLANLNTPQGRKDLDFPAKSRRPAGRQHDRFAAGAQGEDASCLNLYRPRQPRGPSATAAALTDRDGFAWADAPRNTKNPWRLLDGPSADAVPVILEKNTANYSLNLWGGFGETFEIADGRGQPLRLRVAASYWPTAFFKATCSSAKGSSSNTSPTRAATGSFWSDCPAERDGGRAKRGPGTESGRLRLCRPDHGRAAGRSSGRAEHLLSTFQSLGGLGLLWAPWDWRPSSCGACLNAAASWHSCGRPVSAAAG